MVARRPILRVLNLFHRHAFHGQQAVRLPMLDRCPRLHLHGAASKLWEHRPIALCRTRNHSAEIFVLEQNAYHHTSTACNYRMMGQPGRPAGACSCHRYSTPPRHLCHQELPHRTRTSHEWQDSTGAQLAKVA
jgi:hypothetical protein